MDRDQPRYNRSMSQTILVELGDELGAFVDARAASTHDGDIPGFIHSLLREQMELDRLRDELRAGIDRGLMDLEAGRFITLDHDRLRVELEAVMAEGRRMPRRGA